QDQPDHGDDADTPREAHAQGQGRLAREEEGNAATDVGGDWAGGRSEQLEDDGGAPQAGPTAPPWAPNASLAKPPQGGGLFRGASRARTGALVPASHALSQLSYSPKLVFECPVYPLGLVVLGRKQTKRNLPPVRHE